VDRPFHKEPSGEVKERQAALFGSFPQEAHDLGHALFARAPVAALLVHVGRAGRAFAVGRSDDAEGPASEQSLEFCAWAVAYGYSQFILFSISRNQSLNLSGAKACEAV